jgi:hypothetical protein
MGTGGEEQHVVFTYAFHRALGTFREPSHLAEWLLVPFFLGLLPHRARDLLWPMLIGLVVLLTGSLTGIGGAALGSGVAVAILNPLRFGTVKTAFGLVFVLGISYVMFSLLAVSYGDGGVDLLQVVCDRVKPILEGGMGQSNRGPIYEYLESSPIPALGQGMGNATLCFSDYMGVDIVASFLSLYFNTLYSTGYVGFLLLCLYLLQPIWAMWRAPRVASKHRRLVFLAAYCSWLVVYAVHAEELSIMFATVYAMTSHESRNPLDPTNTWSKDDQA